MVQIILVLILAYLLGSIPSGLIIGKVFYKTDIREHGSGNLGGTNTFRTLGVKAGLAVTLADILKGTLAASLPVLFSIDINPLLAGVVAVVGHTYPIFAGFLYKFVHNKICFLIIYDCWNYRNFVCLNIWVCA